MFDMFIFRLASRNVQWLGESQSLVASNIANANTPGYRARQIAPFSMQDTGARFELAATNPQHISTSSVASAPFRTHETESPETTLSGNSVNLEQQMVELGNINRSHTMDVNIQRAFHQMLLASLK